MLQYITNLLFFLVDIEQQEERKDSLPSTNKIPLHNRIVYCHVLNMLWGYYVKCHQDYGNQGKEV